MKILKKATAGTLESSDVMVTVLPNSNGIVLNIESSVFKQYGTQIRETVMNVIDNLSVDNIEINLKDQGALDCTIKSRVETAILRAGDYTNKIKWGEMIV